MSDWERTSSQTQDLHPHAFYQATCASDGIESWRCAACHRQPLDAYRQQFSEACIQCFERRLATYRDSLRLTWSMHEHRQGIVLATIFVLGWLGAATDACW